jgi:hypothetical protein
MGKTAHTAGKLGLCVSLSTHASADRAAHATLHRDSRHVPMLLNSSALSRKLSTCMENGALYATLPLSTSPHPFLLLTCLRRPRPRRLPSPPRRPRRPRRRPRPRLHPRRPRRQPRPAPLSPHPRRCQRWRARGWARAPRRPPPRAGAGRRPPRRAGRRRRGGRATRGARAPSRLPPRSRSRTTRLSPQRARPRARRAARAAPRARGCAARRQARPSAAPRPRGAPRRGHSRRLHCSTPHRRGGSSEGASAARGARA